MNLPWLSVETLTTFAAVQEAAAKAPLRRVNTSGAHATALRTNRRRVFSFVSIWPGVDASVVADDKSTGFPARFWDSVDFIDEIPEWLGTFGNDWNKSDNARKVPQKATPWLFDNKLTISGPAHNEYRGDCKVCRQMTTVYLTWRLAPAEYSSFSSFPQSSDGVGGYLAGPEWTRGLAHDGVAEGGDGSVWNPAVLLIWKSRGDSQTSACGRAGEADMTFMPRSVFQSHVR
jgi:hypothetical protein